MCFRASPLVVRQREAALIPLFRLSIDQFEIKEAADCEHQKQVFWSSYRSHSFETTASLDALISFPKHESMSVQKMQAGC